MIGLFVNLQTSIGGNPSCTTCRFPTTMAAMMAKGEPRRLRVLFADELGRHVLRHRGFSACWFLVPRDARIVGDLAYALVKEFELTKRCPTGVDLTLDELQLPPNQDISIVRDNDAIVVQCALRSDLDAVNRYSGKRNSQAELICARSSSSDEESEEEDNAEAREQLRLLAKKSKARLKKAVKRSDKRAVKGKRVVTKSQPVAAPADTNPSSSDSDSDSNSSSSRGSSSSSESEASDVHCGASDRSSTETRKQPGDQVRSTEPSAPVLPSRPAAAPPAASNGRRQPRQRKRQRRRRRDRHRGAEDEVATEDKGQSSASVHEPEARTVGPVADAVPPRCEVVISKRYPRSKGHLRFDGGLNEEIVDAQVEVVEDPTGVSGHRQVSPDLEKYGPSSTGKRSHNHENGEQASAHGRGNRGYRGQDAVLHHDGHGDTDGFVPRRKKARREELWRRPYEVVATVLDKPAKDSSAGAVRLTCVWM